MSSHRVRPRIQVSIVHCRPCISLRRSIENICGNQHLRSQSQKNIDTIDDLSFGSAGSHHQNPTPLNHDRHSPFSLRTLEVKAYELSAVSDLGSPQNLFHLASFRQFVHQFVQVSDLFCQRCLNLFNSITTN